MRRRAFIAGLGGAAAWPLVARAQQPLPVAVYLQIGQARGDLSESRNKAWIAGLNAVGFDNGRNVIFEPVPVPDDSQLPAVVAAQIQHKPAVIWVDEPRWAGHPLSTRVENFSAQSFY
jgi:putative ABC transport system substrate-binding protein